MQETSWEKKKQNKTNQQQQNKTPPIQLNKMVKARLAGEG